MANWAAVQQTLAIHKNFDSQRLFQSFILGFLRDAGMRALSYPQDSPAGIYAEKKNYLGNVGKGSRQSNV